MLTIKDVESNEEINTFIVYCQKQLDALGYTEHGKRHAKLVSTNCGVILKSLGYDKRTIELGEIAGYLHDIGNTVNRVDHAHTGAILAYNLLSKMDMKTEDILEIMMAIGNHDELTGTPNSPITSALILADKADVHKSRVRNRKKGTFQIHDRVNYAVKKSKITVDKKNKKITLKLDIDVNETQIMDYFEIFTGRMLLCKEAAKFLGMRFELVINEARLLG